MRGVFPRACRVGLAALMVSLFLPTVAVTAAPPGTKSPDAVWTALAKDELETRRGTDRAWIRPDKFEAVMLDPTELEQVLFAAPREFTEAGRSAPALLTLPRPDGTFEAFSVVYSPVYEDGFEDRMAEHGWLLRTYRGTSLDRPGHSLRLDWGGPNGFHGSVLGPEGSWYIDPYWHGDILLYASYYRRDLTPRKDQRGWQCLQEETEFDFKVPADFDWHATKADEAAESLERGGGSPLRTLRLAISATGEYSNFYSGQVNAQAGLVTTTNRMNQVYEIDTQLRFLLVVDNINVVYPNPATDPYTTTSPGGMMMNICMNTLNSVIGSANYDIGHVVSAGGSGGIAGAIGNACNNTVGNGHKGRGATSWTAPVGDPFDIDYVAHELGHQMGCQHTWSYCGSNVGHGLAVEPGSGVTIMAYAGICGGAAGGDLQSNSDAMFHGRSIVELDAYMASGGVTCEATIGTLNNAQPTINAGADYTIPANTPFELIPASFGDTDGDTITFSWEGNDSKTSGNLPPSTVSHVTGAIYRTRLPATNPVKIFPPIANLVAGSTPPLGERLGTGARTTTMRCVVRDNNAEAGRTNFDTMVMTVVNTGTSFAVTAPNGGGTLSGTTAVTWTVAGTDGGTINCATVDVFLSTDGGFTYPITLATGLPNDGADTVVLPNITTSTARLKIKGGNNIFFDISNANFSIVPGVPTPFFDSGGPIALDDVNPGFANGNGIIETGESGIDLTFPIINSGTAGATGIIGTLASTTGTATVTSSVASFADMGIGGGGNNLTPYTISVSPAHLCGAPINLQLTMDSAEGGMRTINYSLPTGTLGAPMPIFTDGFESGNLSAFTSGGLGWGARTDAASLAAPLTGTFLGSHEPAVANVRDSRLISPPIANPTQLSFWHKWVMEQQNGTTGYDMCVLEISTAGAGGPWTNLSSAITAGGTTHTANGCCASPLAAGTPGWSGGAIGDAYINTIVDLSAYSSQTVHIAWRYCEDNIVSVINQGWYLDDISVTSQTFSCAAVPVELSAFGLE